MNVKLCKNCNKQLSSKKIKAGNIFCNKSCSASFTNKNCNKKYENRKRNSISKFEKVFNKQDLTNAVKQGKSLTDVLEYFGYKGQSSYRCKILKEKIKKYNLCTEHFSNHSKKRNIEELLVKNSDYNRTTLKTRLLKKGLLKNKCYICGIDPEWNGKKLSLQIDHINGVNNDNRLENLRILCPNCHSQTPNFAGKNKSR